MNINYPELERINTHDCLAQNIFNSNIQKDSLFIETLLSTAISIFLNNTKNTLDNMTRAFSIYPNI